MINFSWSYPFSSKPWHSSAGARFNQPVSHYNTLSSRYKMFFVIIFGLQLFCGGAVALRSVRVRALAGDTELCFWTSHYTLTVPRSTQLYKWVPAILMLGLTLGWTSIPSKGSRFTLLRPISAGLIWTAWLACRLYFTFTLTFPEMYTLPCIGFKSWPWKRLKNWCVFRFTPALIHTTHRYLIKTKRSIPSMKRACKESSSFRSRWNLVCCCDRTGRY